MRGGLEFSAMPGAHRIRQRGKAGRDIADQACIEAMIEREALGRLLDLDRRPRLREMAAFRVPDVLEERPAQQQHEIGTVERFADLRRIARQ